MRSSIRKTAYLAFVAVFGNILVTSALAQAPQPFLQDIKVPKNDPVPSATPLVKKTSSIAATSVGTASSIKSSIPLLAETAIPLADLDAAALARQLKDAEEDVADAKTDAARAKAAETLDHLKALQAAL